MNQKHSRRVASEKVRGILNELADAVCQARTGAIPLRHYSVESVKKGNCLVKPIFDTTFFKKNT
jgi:hypothetical protein